MIYLLRFAVWDVCVAYIFLPTDESVSLLYLTEERAQSNMPEYTFSHLYINFIWENDLKLNNTTLKDSLFFYKEMLKYLHVYSV